MTADQRGHGRVLQGDSILLKFKGADLPVLQSPSLFPRRLSLRRLSPRSGERL